MYRPRSRRDVMFAVQNGHRPIRRRWRPGPAVLAARPKVRPPARKPARSEARPPGGAPAGPCTTFPALAPGRIHSAVATVAFVEVCCGEVGASGGAGGGAGGVLGWCAVWSWAAAWRHGGGGGLVGGWRRGGSGRLAGWRGMALPGGGGGTCRWPEREEIAQRGVAGGAGVREIAAGLGRAPSTVSRGDRQEQYPGTGPVPGAGGAGAGGRSGRCGRRREAGG